MRDHFLTRREAAIGFATCCAPACLRAAGPARTQAIDVHHHLYPPVLIAALRRTPPRNEDPILGLIERWTPEASLAEMDAAGVASAMVSISFRISSLPLPTNGIRDLTRATNEYAADMRRSRPTRFGFFAHLPLPNIELALDELIYALDTLKADGVGLITSYGEHYLGDPLFVPILEELHRRSAVAFVHPSAPQCCRSPVPLAAALDYPYDTGRTFMSLLFSGALRRYPNIRWILPHAGAALPVLAGRLETLSSTQDLSVVAPQGLIHELGRLHYDLANSCYQPTVDALLDLVPASQVLFGTDYPYIPVTASRTRFDALRLAPAYRAPILRANAVRLFPSLGG